MNQTEIYYDSEILRYIRECYLEGTPTISIANNLRYPEFSVIYQLKRMGIYRVSSDPKPQRITKATLINAIAEITGESHQLLASLEKADKPTIQVILKHLKI